MKGLSLEVRVGMLILVALVLLGAFVLFLGDFGMGGGYTVYGDFDNPGNLKPGAAVNVGGIKIGTVEELQYRGNRLDPKTGRRSLIRVRMELEEEVRETIHEDALFYVTSQSILGENVIAVDPGSPEQPVLEEGAVVEGIDPPRLDLALALGYELLENMVKLFRTHREEIHDLLSGAASMLRSMNEILAEHRGRIDRILANIETATEEASALMVSARGALDGPKVERIVNNLDRTLSAVAKDIEPIMADVRLAAGKVNETLDAIGPEERAELKRTIGQAAELAERANGAIADAQEIIAHVKAGRGTVGAVLMDEELYDDIQEMLRDLKHNPWKFLWRE